MKRTSIYAILFTLLLVPAAALRSHAAAAAKKAVVHSELGRPDLEAIEKASTDENSEYYYPRLHKMFMANDTTMTDEQFQYFYYGTFFQEDYDPYRESPNPRLLQELQSVYTKQNRTRSDRNKMADYATQALDDNPVDLRQLTNRIYVFEQNGKYDLARIWQYKLNHLLLVIARSGTGTDMENARIVVYPQHEYDFLNLSGLTAVKQEFVPPGFDYIMTQSAGGGENSGYYFDIRELLNQYFRKHPSELEHVSDTVSDAE